MVGDWRAALMATPAAPMATPAGPGTSGAMAPPSEPVVGAEQRRTQEVGLQLLQTENPGMLLAYQAETESEAASVAFVTSHQSSLSEAMMELIQLMKNQVPNDPLSVNFGELDDFASMATTPNSNSSPSHSFTSELSIGEWIMDMGATNHMSGNLELFSKFSIPDKAIKISLPDRSKKDVKLIGEVVLSNTITLSQDRTSKQIRAVGRLRGRLYMLDQSSFSISASVSDVSQHAQHVPDSPSSRPAPEATATLPLHDQAAGDPQIPTSAAEVDGAPDLQLGSVIRRSTRPRTQPAWMRDFVCNTTSSSPVILSTDYVACLANSADLHEPRTYAEACLKPEWREAMQLENYLTLNHTEVAFQTCAFLFTITPLLEGCQLALLSIQITPHQTHVSASQFIPSNVSAASC
ncbi:hypothetical protein Salat_1882400 [Sesamum alatum]|uniref:Retrovirus-related Pol polyprotein from transposon TNT 1-94-like beta-barrel domain-containing protein n=1 Tax=Sesamum alatum TaxID=300844 RepID=A0AAE1Y4J6_9LAMI|nr:hypothetical protein Salat_1882400 [Sesamum alatum]